MQEQPLQELVQPLQELVQPLQEQLLHKVMHMESHMESHMAVDNNLGVERTYEVHMDGRKRVAHMAVGKDERKADMLYGKVKHVACSSG